MLQQLDDDGVLHVTFNRPPKKNAFDDAQWDAFAATLHEAAGDPRVAVVLLTGAGGNFSSGVDLASFTGGASLGITIVAGMPWSFAASATDERGPVVSTLVLAPQPAFATNPTKVSLVP